MIKLPFFVISDTHFFHDNIVEYCGRHYQIEMMLGPKKSYPIDHNKYMVEQWNSVVGYEDTVLHLGDLCLWYKDGPAKFASSIAPRLNGKKYIIMGNHDHSDPEWYEAQGFTVVGDFGMKINGKMVTFSHYPHWYGEMNGKTNYRHVHGHVHNGPYPGLTKHDPDKHYSAINQINVSVEMQDYTPKDISTLIS